jgi:membrane protease YdiL (CAAX protease family)
MVRGDGLPSPPWGAGVHSPDPRPLDARVPGLGREAVVEELYFRGHLLPAVDRYGAWAPVLTVALFTLYHFESPWESPGRFLLVLPMAWVLWRKRSVRFGVVVHVALNTLSALGLTCAVLAARGG